MDMDQTLKEILQSITLDSPATQHIEKIAAISNSHPHSIAVLHNQSHEPLEDYNCVMYALDLVARLQEPCRPFGHFYADTNFLNALIQKRILTSSKEVPGNIIVWSDDAQQIKHVGIVSRKDMAISKWGIGNLYEHGFHEVPESYGCHLSFFEPIEAGTVLEALTKFHAGRL